MEHDASKHLVYLSGEMLPPDQAKISVFDTAVTLGDTVTESTRTFGHKPFKLEAHIQRLYKSLKVSRINPGLVSGNEMTATTLEVAGDQPAACAAAGGCLDRAQHLSRHGRGRGRPHLAALPSHHHHQHRAHDSEGLGRLLHRRLPRCNAIQPRDSHPVARRPHQESQPPRLYAGRSRSQAGRPTGTKYYIWIPMAT